MEALWVLREEEDDECTREVYRVLRYIDDQHTNVELMTVGDLEAYIDEKDNVVNASINSSEVVCGRFGGFADIATMTAVKIDYRHILLARDFDLKYLVCDMEGNVRRIEAEELESVDRLCIFSFIDDKELCTIPELFVGDTVPFIEVIMDEEQRVHEKHDMKRQKIIGIDCYIKYGCYTCDQKEGIETLVVPNSVYMICDVRNRELTKVKLGRNVRVISTMALARCRALAEVELNEGLLEIQKEAFEFDGSKRVRVKGLTDRVRVGENEFIQE